MRSSLFSRARMLSATAVIAAGGTCGPLALAATAAPAGNPFARLTADQIAKKAETDLKAASSFHYHGSGKASGQTFSISMSVTHKGCTGGISAGREGGLAIVDIGKTAGFSRMTSSGSLPESRLPSCRRSTASGSTSRGRAASRCLPRSRRSVTRTSWCRTLGTEADRPGQGQDDQDLRALGRCSCGTRPAGRASTSLSPASRKSCASATTARSVSPRTARASRSPHRRPVT